MPALQSCKAATLQETPLSQGSTFFAEARVHGLSPAQARPLIWPRALRNPETSFHGQSHWIAEHIPVSGDQLKEITHEPVPNPLKLLRPGMTTPEWRGPFSSPMAFSVLKVNASMAARRPIEGLFQGVPIKGLPRHAQFARQAGGGIVGDPVIGFSGGFKRWYWKSRARHVPESWQSLLRSIPSKRCVRDPLECESSPWKNPDHVDDPSSCDPLRGYPG